MSHDPSFRPSSAHRWMKCGASVVIDVPSRPSGPAANRGKDLHAIAEQCLKTDDVACVIEGDPVQAQIDADSINAYIDFVRARPGKKVYEGKTVFIPGQEGFIDTTVIDDSLLEIIDYKTGQIYVDPRENEQLIIYACGVAERLAPVYDFEKVKLTIVQPAVDNYSSWEIPLKELEEHGARILARVEEIKSGVAEFDASDPEACRWCDAKSWADPKTGEYRTCPALQDAAQEAARQDFGSLTPFSNPQSTTGGPLTLPEMLRLAAAAETWCKQVRADARQKLLEGEQVEGYKLVAGRGSRDWSNRRGAVDTLTGWGFGETDIYTEPEMKSPAQMEKLVKGKGSGAKKKELKEFIEKKPGKPTIVSDSDKRPAISSDEMAKRDFAEYLEEGGDE